MSGIPLKNDLSKTEKNDRQLYSFGDEYVFEWDTPSYIAGVDRKKNCPEMILQMIYIILLI